MWIDLFWWLGILVLFAGILFLIDRLLLWMEGRGWIYWRKTKAGPGTARHAWLNLQSMVEPSKEYIIEMEEAEHEEEDGEAGPDDPTKGFSSSSNESP